MKMNFMRVFQLSTLIFLEVFGPAITAEMAKCTIKPTDVEKVDVVIYMNAGTRADETWYGQFCYWRAEGMNFDQYAPITVNVGAEITCDSNNNCNCPNKDIDQFTCALTFRFVCLKSILGQNEFQDLLCCSLEAIDGQVKGFNECVDDIPDLREKVASCMADKGPGNPQAVALKVAQEVVDKGVDLANNAEPFFFYNGIFDKCISDDSPNWFLEKICLMLKRDVANSIPQCVSVMGWPPS